MGIWISIWFTVELQNISKTIKTQLIIVMIIYIAKQAVLIIFSHFSNITMIKPFMIFSIPANQIYIMWATVERVHAYLKIYPRKH